MLTDAKARKIAPNDKPIAVGGVVGLYLRPGKKQGTGKFQMRFVSPETGKRRDMGLGSYPATGLAQARILAFKARQLLEHGIDPIEQRSQQAAKARQELNIPTFSEAAQTVYDDIAPSFKNTKHSAQWISTLKNYVFPTIGNKRVDQLTPGDFAAPLKGIWLTKPETASRVRQRCERVMLWSLAHGHCTTNPVSAVSALLPKQPSKRDRVKHHPAVPWRLLPEVFLTLFDGPSYSMGKQALHFLILTGARSEEVRGANWTEIDLATATWAIPGERMKTRQPHRIPLSTQALSVLQWCAEMSGRKGLLFENRKGKPLSDMTLLKVLRDHDIPSDSPGRNATVHGFRSSLRDWASENGYACDLAERALAHTVANAAEAAYHRTDLLDQRRGMMQDWADHVWSARS